MKYRSIYAFLLVLAMGLAAVGIVPAQVPGPPEPAPEGSEAEPRPESQEAPNGDTETSSQGPRPGSKHDSIFMIQSDFTLPAGEEAREVVIVLGDMAIEGKVRGDVVSILGACRLASTAEVEGDLVVVGGTMEVEPGAVVDGDAAVVAGSTDLPDTFSPGGDLVNVLAVAQAGPIGSLFPWFWKGLVWGRPIVPSLPWVWVVVLVCALGYLLVNLVFEQAVRECSVTLSEKPLTTFLVGVMVLLLIAPVCALLALSIVGLPVIPFLALGLVLMGFFGRVGVLRWIGQRIVAEDPMDGQLAAARSLAIGMGAVSLAYMVPVIGFTAWATVGVFGLGAAASALVAALRREHPTAAGSRAGEVAAAGLPGPDSADQEAAVGSEAPEALPTAGFLSRLGAVAIDAVVLAISAVLLEIDFGGAFVLCLIYHTVLWAWKATTVGGMVCQVRVARVDGAPLQFSDALVRSLAAIISAAVAGLGWFWALWDSRSQSWHDKIAGTHVVQVPSGTPQT